jgi:hypothetical protein
MSRMIRDFVELKDGQTLDALIQQLSALRDHLPHGARDTRVRLRGDDVFGRTLSIGFLRPQTAEELALESRYTQALRYAA